MPQPPAYNRTKDFTENFGSETDHTSINAELDAVSNSINTARANLALMQADDGKIKADAITIDSLSQPVMDQIIDEASQGVVTYTNQANASAAEALTSQNAAAASQTAAATSATNAGTSATAAASSASAASTSATNAATSASTASTAATTATTKAGEAATSATTASTKAGEAATSATTASGHATTATTKAGEAATSATNAANSATAASTSATNAGNSATAAATSATNAATFNPALYVAKAELQGLRNKIINGNFRINQRAVSGTVTLAAGAYGHDRWKAGASGCTYTFATTNNITTITITAGSLQQVIEGDNLQSGDHILSWSGTAQGRINASAYGATGRTATLTGGTNATVEFGTGTLSKAQIEEGTTATAFDQRPIGLEDFLCKRYYEKGFFVMRSNGTGAGGAGQWVPYVAKRAAATIAYTNTAYSYGCSGLSSGGYVNGFECFVTASAAFAFSTDWAASAEL